MGTDVQWSVWLATLEKFERAAKSDQKTLFRELEALKKATQAVEASICLYDNLLSSICQHGSERLQIPSVFTRDLKTGSNES